MWARKNFERRGATVLKNNLNKVRSQMNRPTWILPAVWSTLCDHWGTREFKKKSIQAKKNRASDRGGFGGSFHTCGSITTSQHRANMVKFPFFFFILTFIYDSIVAMCVCVAVYKLKECVNAYVK